MELKGTQTEKNLLAAFAGESQARNRYVYAAKAAQKEGYVQIGKIFEQTAAQEQVHAKQFFLFLKGGPLEITATYPAGCLGTTIDNLRAAADGELEEWSQLYPAFAATARDEGFQAVARKFEEIAIAEKHHEEQYRGLLRNIEEGTVFKKDKPVVWVCQKCGWIHEGPEAPGACPACAHPQAHFELFVETW